MSNLILTLTDQPALLQWAGERVTGQEKPWFWPSDSKAMGFLDGASGKVLAVVVLNAFGPDSCEMHFASDGRRKWATYGTLRGMFHYIFMVLGVRRVIASTPTDNVAAVTAMQKMGFTVEGLLRTEPDGSATNTVGQMFDVECKFIADLIGVENGQAKE